MITQLPAASQDNRSRLLIVTGVVWLALATLFVLYQLTTPVSVQVEWTTAAEVRTAGFHLYRGQSAQGDFALLNEEMIPSRGNAATGAAYSYLDQDVQAGRTYYYLLEEVETDLTARRYQQEIFSLTTPRLVWWALLLALFSAALGLALLVAGLRLSRKL